MKNKIAVYGAFDRFNYGDLLFAVVLDHMFKKHRDYELVYYGLVESDLSHFGGLPTRPVKELFSPGAFPDGGIVIVAGGEVLEARWFLLHRYLLPMRLGLFLKILQKISGKADETFLDKMSRAWLECPNMLPFVLDSGDFNTRVKIAYNAVGGFGITHMPKIYQKDAAFKLLNADYLSVRDHLTEKAIQKLSPNTTPFVTPDSAALMTTLFPKKELIKRISPFVSDILNRFEKGFVCFQCADYLAKNHIDIICRELERIYRKKGLSAVLLPIGRAAGHEDQVALEKISEKLSSPHELPPDMGIYDIMALIAFSSVFFGTSLHGNITAMAFGVPHLGLTYKVGKLETYLKTWGLPPFTRCIPFSVMGATVGGLMNTSKKERLLHGEKLCRLAKQNMIRMKTKLGVLEAS